MRNQVVSHFRSMSVSSRMWRVFWSAFLRAFTSLGLQNSTGFLLPQFLSIYSNNFIEALVPTKFHPLTSKYTFFLIWSLPKISRQQSNSIKAKREKTSMLGEEIGVCLLNSFSESQTVKLIFLVQTLCWSQLITAVTAYLKASVA